MEAPLKGDDHLKSLQEIPEKYRSLFSSYPSFNRVQSAVFGDIMESTCSVVVTAPTGSGKTVLFELALVKLLMETPYPRDLKAVYVAPVKALCNERYQDWNPKLERLGISCVEVTGDSVDQYDLQDYQVILTTPEKWDSLTRRWRDNVGLVQLVKLMMIDEVHLLSDSKRGPTLETIVCRMKTVMHALKLQTALRFIAVSATIFNIEDLAQWLGNGRECARFHRFGNEMRPVALKRVVRGYPQAKGQSPFLFDIQLSYKLKTLLQEYAEGKPVLIFCSTRRGVVQTCKVLVEQLGFNFTQDQLEVLDGVAGEVSDGKLREYVRAGVGYHHAGLTTRDRMLMQDTFMQGSLPVLVATTTLAMGVNLPAHLVIIKSTHQYMAGRIVEYPESSVLQMVGRAGRPQFDTSATAVIMTRNELVRKYQNLLDCKEVLESSLHLHLAEHLNSEIVLFTITDLAVAMDWLRCTFLYQRAFKNPKHYGFTAGNPGKIDKDLELMVLREINALQRAELVELNENGIDVSPTANGRLMSHYYINFRTFQLFTEVGDITSMKDLLKLLSSANELCEVQLRVSERKLLNDLNVSKQTNTIRFPVVGKVKTSDMKVNVLAQACLDCLPIPDPSLQQEAVRIVSTLERVAKCLTEYLTRKTSYCALLSAAILGKCLHAKLWENSAFVARQLDRIGATLGAALVACGKTSFDALMQSHPHELERIMNRGPPMGNSVIEQIRHLPNYSLSVQVDRESVLRCQINVSVQITNADLIAERSTAGKHHAVILIVGDTQNRLLHHRRALDASILSGGLHFRVSVSAPLPQKIFVHLISEQWVGIDTTRDVLMNPMAAMVVGASCYLPALIVEDSSKKMPKKNKKADGKDTSKDRPESEYWKRFKLPSAPVVVPKASPMKKSGVETVVTNNLPPPSFPPTPDVTLNSEDGCCFDLEPEWGDLEEDNPEKSEIPVPKIDREVAAKNANNNPAENLVASHTEPDLEKDLEDKVWEACNISNYEKNFIAGEYTKKETFAELNPSKTLSIPCHEESISIDHFNCRQSFGDELKNQFPSENFPWNPRAAETIHQLSHEEEVCGASSRKYSSEIPCISESDILGGSAAIWQVAEIVQPASKPTSVQVHDSHGSTYNLMDSDDGEYQCLGNIQEETTRDPDGHEAVGVILPHSPPVSPEIISEASPKRFRYDESPPKLQVDPGLANESYHRGYNPPTKRQLGIGVGEDSTLLQDAKELQPKEWTRRQNNRNSYHKENHVNRHWKDEVETILDNVLNKDTLSQAKSADPTKTLDIWKQLEDSFYFSAEPSPACGRKFPRFGSQRSALGNKLNSSKIGDLETTTCLTKFADSQDTSVHQHYKNLDMPPRVFSPPKPPTVANLQKTVPFVNTVQQHCDSEPSYASDPQLNRSELDISNSGKNVDMTTGIFSTPKSVALPNLQNTVPFVNHYSENLQPAFPPGSRVYIPKTNVNSFSQTHEKWSQLPEHHGPDLPIALSSKFSFSEFQPLLSRQGSTSDEILKDSSMQNRGYTQETSVACQFAPHPSEKFSHQKNKHSEPIQKIGKENRPPVPRSLKDYLQVVKAARKLKQGD